VHIDSIVQQQPLLASIEALPDGASDAFDAAIAGPTSDAQLPLLSQQEPQIPKSPLLEEQQDELLKQSISSTKPDDVLPTLELLDGAMMNAMATATNAGSVRGTGDDSGGNNDDNNASGSTSSTTENCELGDVPKLSIDTTSPGSRPIVSDDETVNAVLAAAGEAVVAAEATFKGSTAQSLEIETTDDEGDVLSIPLVSPTTLTPPVDEATSAAANAASDVAAVDLANESPLATTETISSSSSSSSSSTVTTKQHEEIMAQAPNVRKILKFAIPAIGVWLCGPLLSLIDTSAVGVLSGTAQQAALNPAVAVTDYAALLIAFMYTGTTNLVAAAQSQDRNSADKPVTSKTLIGAMQLSTFVGAGLGAILFVFARPLLRAIIGVNDAISPAVFTAAMKYVRIRAIGMPAAAIIGSAQAACLGMQDIKSPLYVLAAAAIVNFFGDMFFVGSSHPWIGGAAGAAWATVFSQYAAVALFAKWLTSSAKKRMVASSSSSSSSSAPPSDSNNSAPGNVVNLSNAIMEMTGKNSEGESRRSKLKDEMASFSDGSATSQQAATAAAAESSQDNSKVAGRISNLFARSDKTASLAKGKRPFPFSKRKNDTPKKSTASEGSFTVRGFLKNKFTPLDLMKPPSKDILKDFSPYIMPVTSTQFGRVSGYVAMSHVVASSLGTISMAAQQIIVSLFYCLCPIADSLSLTAQSFVPAIAEHKPSHSRAMALRRTIVNFFKAGGLMGAAIVGAVLAIPLVSGFFTSDPVVVALVNSVVPLLVGFFIVHGWMCASEGLLLGQTDLGFLGKMYAVFSVAVPYLMLRVKNAALTGVRPANLTSVWKIFLGYQLFRVVTWVGRVAQLQRRTEQQAKIETVPSI